LRIGGEIPDRLWAVVFEEFKIVCAQIPNEFLAGMDIEKYVHNVHVDSDAALKKRFSRNISGGIDCLRNSGNRERAEQCHGPAEGARHFGPHTSIPNYVIPTWPEIIDRIGVPTVEQMLIICAATLAKFVPLAVLAAILFAVAHNMGEWGETAKLLKLTKSEYLRLAHYFLVDRDCRISR
jgi:hypothetical protein